MKKPISNAFADIRLWHDRTNGNPYTSGRLMVDGEVVKVFPMTYGRGEQTLYEMLEYLSDEYDLGIEGTPHVSEVREKIDFYQVTSKAAKRDMF